MRTKSNTGAVLWLCCVCGAVLWLCVVYFVVMLWWCCIVCCVVRWYCVVVVVCSVVRVFVVPPITSAPPVHANAAAPVRSADTSRGDGHDCACQSCVGFFHENRQ